MKLSRLEAERKLLQHQTLAHRHPQQLLFFADPGNIYVDFTKPISCALPQHRQEVSEQQELAL